MADDALNSGSFRAAVPPKTSGPDICPARTHFAWLVAALASQPKFTMPFYAIRLLQIVPIKGDKPEPEPALGHFAHTSVPRYKNAAEPLAQFSRRMGSPIGATRMISPSVEW